MNKIPLIIVEEHHEAFYVFYYAKFHNVIKNEKNILIHVDEHSDLLSPNLRTKISDVSEQNLKEVQKFTYDELRIANYIIPAIYKGLINEYIWIRNNEKHATDTEYMYIRSRKKEDKVFGIGKTNAWANLNNFNNQVLFKSRKINTKSEVELMDDYILDIDLDYFSCDRFENETRKLEITFDQYNQIIIDKYHYIKLEHNYEMYNKDGKYYIENLDYVDNNNDTDKVSKEEIKNRIEDFISFIEKLHRKPRLIVICRSRFSGYTPKDQWEYIENEVTDRLNDIFDIDIKKINDILVE